MLKEIAEILSRSRHALIEDALGVAALFSFVFVWLYLTPSFT